jgi:hypothetical protein
MHFADSGSRQSNITDIFPFLATECRHNGNVLRPAKASLNR